MPVVAGVDVGNATTEVAQAGAGGDEFGVLFPAKVKRGFEVLARLDVAALVVRAAAGVRVHGAAQSIGEFGRVRLGEQPVGRFAGAGMTFLVGAGAAYFHTIGIPVALTAIAFVVGLALVPLGMETRGRPLPE